MAESVTTASKITGETFPFVRVPMFEVLGSQSRSLTGSEMILWAPLVTEAQQPEWSNYSTSNQNWYNESIDFVTNVAETNGKKFTYKPDAPFLDFIWLEGNETYPSIPSPPPGPFAPIWQCSPPPFSLTFINFDLLKESYVKSLLPSLIHLRDGLMSGILSKVVRLAGIFITAEDHEASHLQHVRDAYNGSTFLHPHCVHLQPVYEELNDHDSNVVGVLLSLVAWDTFMASLLPEGVTGIVAVLHNTCDQNHTYFLDGYKVRNKQQTTQWSVLQTCTHGDCFSRNRHNIVDLGTCMTQPIQIPESKSNFRILRITLQEIEEVIACIPFHCIDRTTFRLKRPHRT
jgi:hypothetical protein